jgi:hypothetical protein
MMSQHESSVCQLPSIFWRRIGVVWCCPVCNKLWFVNRWYSMMDSIKTWEPVKPRGDS